MDNLITLYEYDETLFLTNGLGNLSDASKCEVTEELNGAFELEMEYPITGIHYEDIQLKRIIYTKPAIDQSKQAFRIYAISKPINGIVIVNAEHISYDLSNYVVQAFKAASSTAAISAINSSPKLPPGARRSPFTIRTDINSDKEMESKVPATQRSLIAGNNGSFIETYGGEVEYQSPGFQINIKAEGRGKDHGVSIEYGKNLTDVKQDENCSNMYTHILPYFYYYNETTKTDDAEQETTIIEERTVTVDGDLMPVNNFLDWEAYLNAVKEKYPEFDWSKNVNGYYEVDKIQYMSEYGLWKFSEEDMLVAMSFTFVDSATQIQFVLCDKDGNEVQTSPIDSSTSLDDWKTQSVYGIGSQIKMKYHYVGDAYFKWVSIGITGAAVKVLPVDVSSEWNNTHAWSKEFPSKDQVNEIGLKYLDDHNLKEPEINITVSFELLSQTLDYKDMSQYENVSLGDTVKVIFPAMNISATSKCVKTVYNVLTDKYESIDLGEGKSDFAYKMVESQKQTQTEIIENSDFLTDRLNYAGKMVTGNVGGYVIMRDTDGDSMPDEILIMDQPDYNRALKVWRWNKSGLVYGKRDNVRDDFTWDIAITQEGEIDAQFITTGTMSANRINGGILDVGGSNHVNGLIRVRDANNRVIMEIDHLGLYFKYYENAEDTSGSWIPTKIDANGIQAGSVKAENIIGTTISGKIVRVGGDNDEDGKILVLDDEGNTIITIDHRGLIFAEGHDLQISWGDITDIPGDLAYEDDIPTDGHITQITKDTVTTTYVNALKVKAGSVDAENITGTNINGKTINGGDINGTTITGGSITGANISSVDNNTGYQTSIQNGFLRTNLIDLFGHILIALGGTIGAQRVTPSGGVTDAGSLVFNDGSIKATASFSADGTITGDEIRTLTDTNTSTNAPISMTAGSVPGLLRKYVPASSSIRYKHDFKDKFDEEYDPHNILNIKTYQFKYKTDFLNDPEDKLYDKYVIGFFAEDVYKKYKVASDYYYDKNKNKDVITGWTPYFMIPAMLHIMREQNDDIKSLKEEVSELKAQMSEILKILKPSE